MQQPKSSMCRQLLSLLTLAWASSAAGIHVGSLGNPACWAPSRQARADADDTEQAASLPSFLLCCATRVFGPTGNPACWTGGLSFERCCQGLDPGSREFAFLVNATLASAAGDFSVAVVAFATWLHRLEVERHAAGHRPLHDSEAALMAELSEHISRWQAQHLQELFARLPEVLEAYRSHWHPAGPEPRIAILMACTASTANNDMCRLGASLWQCYARRHGYHFIFDSSQYPDYPTRFEFGSAGGSTALGLQALAPDFGEDGGTTFLEEEPLAFEVGTGGLDFKYWQRWYAARRHLQAYDMLFVVDPDTSVFPSCTDVELPAALQLPMPPPRVTDGGDPWPGILVRKSRPGEDVNGGVVGFTRSPWSLLYLELLIARSRWPLDFAGGSGWCHSRQAAEYDTLLEVMALEQAQREGSFRYRSECTVQALPQAIPDDGKLVAGCAWSSFLYCWKEATGLLSEALDNGEWRHVRFLDPVKEVDINYRPWSNEPRYRQPFLTAGPEALPPIAHAAFLWHYVAIPDKAKHMMRDFGLSSIEDTLDCDRLHEQFMSAARLRQPGGFPPCSLTGSPKVCPFEDSWLMSHKWGC